MVVGYYDMNGCPNLIPGNAYSDIEDVSQAIASQGGSGNPQHYEDYSLPLDTSTPGILADKSAPPAGDEHADNCLADFMHTSWSSDSLRYGWSYSNMISVSWLGYVSLVAPQYQASAENYSSYKPITWEIFTTEIDNSRPMVFLVDTDGNGATDHFVPAFGYRIDDETQEYACWDTWYAPIRWEPFRSMASGRPWGIWGGTRLAITVPQDTPTSCSSVSPVLWKEEE